MQLMILQRIKNLLLECAGGVWTSNTRYIHFGWYEADKEIFRGFFPLEA